MSSIAKSKTIPVPQVTTGSGEEETGMEYNANKSQDCLSSDYSVFELNTQAKMDYLKDRIAQDIPLSKKRRVAVLTVPPCLFYKNGRTFDVFSGINVIGRGEEANIRLETEGVSNVHAIIEVSIDGREHFIEDLKSTNGTRWNSGTELKPLYLYQLLDKRRIVIEPVHCVYNILPEFQRLIEAENFENYHQSVNKSVPDTTTSVTKKSANDQKITVDSVKDVTSTNKNPPEPVKKKRGRPSNASKKAAKTTESDMESVDLGAGNVDVSKVQAENESVNAPLEGKKVPIVTNEASLKKQVDPVSTPTPTTTTTTTAATTTTSGTNHNESSKKQNEVIEKSNEMVAKKMNQHDANELDKNIDTNSLDHTITSTLNKVSQASKRKAVDIDNENDHNEDNEMVVDTKQKTAKKKTEEEVSSIKPTKQQRTTSSAKKSVVKTNRMNLDESSESETNDDDEDEQVNIKKGKKKVDTGNVLGVANTNITDGKKEKQTKKTDSTRTSLSRQARDTEMVDEDVENRSSQVRIMFTGLVDIDRDDQEDLATKIGFEVVDDWKTCTHLVTDKVRRTIKFLCALSSGKYIVNTKWLAQCAKEGRKVPEGRFLLKDTKSEKKWGFILKDSAADAQRIRSSGGLFAGYSFYPSASVVPSRHELAEILRSTGGKLLDDIPTGITPSEKKHIVIIGTRSDQPEIKRLLTKGSLDGSCVQTNECLLSSILRMRFNPRAFPLN